MAVDITGPLPCKPRGNLYFLAATGRPPGEESPQTSSEVVAAWQQRWYQPHAGDVQRLQSKCKMPCNFLERLSDIIYKLGDGTRK